jgi:exopolysaccharide biosynthesis polyprenyl glycosylphosphotransferase
LAPGVFILVALIWPFFLTVFSVYDARRNETMGAELRSVCLAVCVSTLTLAGALFFSYRETSRLTILIFFVLDVALLVGARLLLSGYRRLQNAERRNGRRVVLVIGAGEVGRKAAGQLQHFDWSGVGLIGYVDDDPGKQEQLIDGLPVLGTLDQLTTIVQAHGVRDALIALPLRAYHRQVRVCRALQAMSVHVHVIPDLFALSFPNATLDGFGGIPVVSLGQPGIHGARRVSKRAFDVAVAVLCVVFLSPILALVALAIKLDSPGPILYKSTRIGENGALFTMFKFRSMWNDADSSLHKAYVARLIEENLGLEEVEDVSEGTLKIKDDTRITRVGRIIRKTSVDELPQLFNVLRGDMSLVGPRPPLPYEVALYSDWHKQRLASLPGLTGWWQVKGRNRVSFDEMVRMDLYYAQHTSFWLDLKILFMTPWAVISGRGAG